MYRIPLTLSRPRRSSNRQNGPDPATKLISSMINSLNLTFVRRRTPLSTVAPKAHRVRSMALNIKLNTGDRYVGSVKFAKSERQPVDYGYG